MSVPSHSHSFVSAALAGTEGRGVTLAVQGLSVLFITVLTAAAAQISVPLWFTPVPFTFQPMVVLIGGALLGPRLGMLSQILYLAAGLAGLPVFAASAVLPQGPARLLGPTGGYLMAYPFAAYLTGWLSAAGFGRRYLSSVLAMTGGLLIVFAGGVTWLATFMPAGTNRLAAALQVGFTPFVIADALKVLLAAALLPALWRLTGLHRGSR